MNNVKILVTRRRAFNRRQGARVGDYLRLPHGEYTRFTYDWGETLQTGGGAGSYHLSSTGHLSYSGGLDPGVKRTDIIQTNETKKGFIWFFDEGISGANRGIDTEIYFRVFELIKTANLNGLPQIEQYKKRQIQERTEKMTLINGNGNEYAQPLPEVRIIADDLNDIFLNRLQEQTGVKFQKLNGAYVTQPLKAMQIIQILTAHSFNVKYYNNCYYTNVLVLTFNK